MAREQAIETVIAWQTAVNARDIDRLLELSDPGIEIAGPRGGGHGHDLLRAWLDRASIHLTTERVFARGAVVVVAQRATWHDEHGAPNDTATVASSFRVADGRVTRVARHDHLADALAEMGLAEGGDEATKNAPRE
jgi:hypothetical protein